MPLAGFVCPDNEKILLKACFAKCRMEDRCCPLSWLETIAYDRGWRGVTASMAGNGIRLLHLRRTRMYYVSPDSRAFAIVGTRGHGKLSKADYNRLTEEMLKEGTADLLEQEDDGYAIVDYKVWGSYKVAQLVKTGVAEKNEVMQLNRYRIGFEMAGFPIKRMRLFIVRRDACAQFNKQYKLTSNTCFIQVPFLSNEEVMDYYVRIEKGLEIAMREDFYPMCSDEECWHGRRCTGYCEVSEQCKEYGDNSFLTDKGRV